MGLIVHREQLCEALGVSDSAITDWEKKGMPVVRKGRGRGMRSLYDLDAVRAWCERTGYGHSIQALLARFSRSEPPPAPTGAAIQTSAPARPRCAFGQACAALNDAGLEERRQDLAIAWPVQYALIALPTLLRSCGMPEDLILRAIAAVIGHLKAEGMADEDLQSFRTMLEEERAQPGTWTGDQ
jgi:hypothetical protein